MDSMDADFLSIKKIQQGEEAGLVELMSRHRESLFRFVYRYVANEADAADLTEETFFRIYEKADRFRPKAKVTTWMFTIAGNLCRDFIRKNKKRSWDLSLDAEVGDQTGATIMGAFASDSNDPSEAASAKETTGDIQKAVMRLPQKLKFPFIFCILEDNSYDECAEVLKTSRKTVETRIYRARKILREELSSLQEHV